jgi:hypothetical protein
MAYKVFTNGSVLNASEINENLMRQSVATFTSAAARTAAITSPVEGQVTFLEDQNILSIYDGSVWKTSLAPTGSVIQVLTSQTFTTTTTTTTGVDTALSVTITPKSASNKIFVTTWANDFLQNNNSGASNLRIIRNSTILNATAALYFGTSSSGIAVPVSMGILDSPATTSSTIYKTNLGSSNVLNTAIVRGWQQIVVMEIAA